MPRHITLGLAGLALAASVGCGRWMEYVPLRIEGQVHNTRVVYNRLVRKTHAMGYRVEAQSPRRSHFVVRAFLDQHRRLRHRKASFFHVTVRPGGAVDVAATGFHVRRGGTKIHRKLCHELTAFMDGLAHEVHPIPVVAAR